MDQPEMSSVIPKTVKTAIILLCTSMLVMLIESVIFMVPVILALIVSSQADQKAFLAELLKFSIIGAALNLLIVGFFTLEIAKRRNWARVVFLILSVLELSFAVRTFPQVLVQSAAFYKALGFSLEGANVMLTLNILTTILQWGLTITALVLLFQRASSGYFAKPKTAQ